VSEPMDREPETTTRRKFLGRMMGVLVVPQVQDSLAGRGAVGTLRDPTALGRPLTPTDPEENAAEIQAIELKLACNCGCTLDVFTCRTTDFTCTYSPKLHREVVELDRSGKTAQEILDAFVNEYGEKALMAPKAEGFNLWGYLLPGSAILVAAGALVAVLSRRRAAVAEAGGAGIAEPRPIVERPGSEGKSTPAPASPEEMERLRRALAEVED
jgi:cytochrome c-type biogenesis protein CcmH